MADGAIMRHMDTVANISPAVLPEHVLVVATAGYTRESPSTPVPARMRALSTQFIEWLRTFPEWTEENSVANPCCWSTGNEIRQGFALAINYGADPTTHLDVYIGSSDSYWHQKRIAAYVRKYCPPKWKVHIVRSSHPMSRKERWLLEPLKWLKAVRARHSR
jgi:hypothetical protein